MLSSLNFCVADTTATTAATQTIVRSEHVERLTAASIHKISWKRLHTILRIRAHENLNRLVELTMIKRTEQFSRRAFRSHHMHSSVRNGMTKIQWPYLSQVAIVLPFRSTPMFAIIQLSAAKLRINPGARYRPYSQRFVSTAAPKI